MKQLTLVTIIFSLLLMQGCVSNQSRNEDPEKAATIYADLGLEYLRKGNLELALVKLERSLELDNKHPKANHYIAEVYKQMGNLDLADEYYGKAVKYDSENPMLLNNYGAFLCDQGRIEESEEYFIRASKTPRYRNPELTYENIALCAMQAENIEKAEEFFRKALQIRPALHKSLYQMANISYDKKEFMKARAFIERFHSIAKTESSLKLGIQIEEALGDETAVEEYRQALSARFQQSVSEE